MNWKKRFRNARMNSPDDGRETAQMEHFISTEIIEKLINDIPNDLEIYSTPDGNGMAKDLRPIKQQLKAKWLEE